MSQPLNVLMVEDSESDAALVVRMLRKADFDVHDLRVETAEEMQAALENQAWDMVISDYNLPQFNTPAALALLKQTSLDIPFIIVSGAIGEETAVAMMKAGAHDYVMKDNLARLGPAVERELREAQTRRERKRAEQALRESELRFSTVFHASPITIAINRLTDDQYIDVNEAWLKLTGFTRQEVIGRTPFDLNLWVDPGARDRLIKNIRQRGAVQSYEFQLRQKSGEISDLLLSAEIIKLSTGPCLLSMALDITQRKQMESDLKNKVDTLQALAEIDRQIISATDSKEILELVCSSAARLLNLPKAAVAVKDASNQMQIIATQGIEDFAQLKVEFNYQWNSGLMTGERLAQGGIADAEIAPGNRFMPGFCERENIHAFALTPMMVSNQWMGLLAIFDTVRHPWSKEETDILALLTGQAAIALQHTRLFEQVLASSQENAHLYEAERRRTGQLMALRAIDQAISGSVDLSVVLNILLEQLTRQLGVDAACVLVYKPHDYSLTYSAGRGFRTAGFSRAHLRVDEGMPGRAAQERKTIHTTSLAFSLYNDPRASIMAEEQFTTYYGLPLITKGQFAGVLEVFHRSTLTPDDSWHSFLESLAGQAAIAIENASLFNDLQRSNMDLAMAYDSTIEGWSKTLDLRDKETEGHSIRVTEMTLRLAHEMGLNDEDLVHVRRGALLHDIGKMGVPDHILLKPGPLTDQEWELMRNHPTHAHMLLSPIQYLRPALDIPYCHHEKWDGSGYPRGLKGEGIPLVARIFAIVDVWDALTSDRPYRPAWSKEKALTYLRDQSGKHFDPRVVDAFFRVNTGLEF